MALSTGWPLCGTAELGGYPVCAGTCGYGARERPLALHQKKKRRRPGLPELVAAGLIAVMVVLAFCWWHTRGQPGWLEANGQVTVGRIQATHFNAESSENKVYLSYEYDVGGITYAGHWEGYWPMVRSPNALTSDRIAELKTIGYPLTVLFDPRNPERSDLHNSEPDRLLLYRLLTFAAGVLLLVYCAKVYPAWKERQRRRIG